MGCLISSGFFRETLVLPLKRRYFIQYSLLTQKERHSELAAFTVAATDPIPPVVYSFSPFLTLTFHMPSPLISLPIVNLCFYKIATKTN